MSELQALLDAFIRREATLDSFRDAIADAVHNGPTRAEEARALLSEARDAQRIDEAAYGELIAALGAGAGSGGLDSGGLGSGDDKTVILTGGTGGRAVPGAFPIDPDLNEHPTEMGLALDDGDDPTRTESEMVADATIERPATPAPAPTDPTSDDEDATVVRGPPLVSRPTTLPRPTSTTMTMPPSFEGSRVARTRPKSMEAGLARKRPSSMPALPRTRTRPPRWISAAPLTRTTMRPGSTLRPRSGTMMRPRQTSLPGTRNDDTTQVNVAPGPDEDGDRTVVLQDEAFDILDPNAMAEAEGAGGQTDASWPTSVADAGPAAAAPAREFDVGDVLKDRFELVAKLGEGGMGAVWKAKDKLKEEARDRNPFVAVKLLQGDFKEHPEAFIALQRETSKQQRLAHPNIARLRLRPRPRHRLHDDGGNGGC